MLLLGRHLAHEHIVSDLTTVLRAGALTADAVALEARKAAQAEDEPAAAEVQRPRPAAGPGEASVPFLHKWKLNHLPPDTRPLPSVTHYDQLLRHRRAGSGDLREEEAP
ncbi:hypothetical protein ACFV1C_02775 [Streptomyces sp. NPDC059605]|uniref:hypothetical protein n=1 Tax=unclassified Streptomyces TaxID=2593676 RepID=UPI0036D0A6C7